NHSAPSGPAVMGRGELFGVGIGNSVTLTDCANVTAHVLKSQAAKSKLLCNRDRSSIPTKWAGKNCDSTRQLLFTRFIVEPTQKSTDATLGRHDVPISATSAHLCRESMQVVQVQKRYEACPMFAVGPASWVLLAVASLEFAKSQIYL